MRFITYNVNSLNARLPRVLALLDEYQPDVVCLQETKASPEKFPHLELRAVGYDAADNSGGDFSPALQIRAVRGPADIPTTGTPGLWLLIGAMIAVCIFAALGGSVVRAVQLQGRGRKVHLAHVALILAGMAAIDSAAQPMR